MEPVRNEPPTQFMLRKLRELGDQRFYGGVEIKFENGTPVLVKVSQNFRPTYRTERGEREHDSR